MIYPDFLEEGSVIGICAPSAGVGKKLDDFEQSLEVLHNEGFETVETDSVRIDADRGGDAYTRAEELKELFEDPDVNMVWAAAGGDFLMEMLEYTDFDAMAEHPKWFMGASDPTGLLFPYTVACDVATLYGFNAGSYDIDPAPQYAEESLKLLKGEIPYLESSEMHMGQPKYTAEEISFEEPTVYESNCDELDVSGRCIGGCIDSIKDIIGTPLVPMDDFLERYKDDGTIFFFDNFSMSAENFYRTLLQMRYAGWFRYTQAVLIGRVCFPSSETGMTYREALDLALTDADIPYISEVDIGHTLPCMPIISGAIMNLHYEDGKAAFTFELR